jgi:hypothetical protein
MTGGSRHTRERVQQAPIGFCPLQRPKLRKSTDPRFPSLGSFPSRRFSRPQGLAPSEAARACSIPLPLLGFHLQSPPVGGDALAGKPPSCLPHRLLPRPKGQKLQSAPHVGWTPRRVPDLRTGGTSVRTARHRPRCPLVSGQAHLRDKALLAARTSFEPALLQPHPASRAFPPGRRRTHPKVNSDRAGLEPTEGPHVPKDAGSPKAQSLDQTRAYRPAAGGFELRVGQSKLQPSLRSPPQRSANPKAHIRLQPRPARTRPDSNADLAHRGAARRGKEQAPSVASSDPPSAGEHKARRRRRPDPVEGTRPRAVPGERPCTGLTESKLPARPAPRLPIPPSRGPTGPETRRRMDFAASVCKIRREHRVLCCRSKPPLRCPLARPTSPSRSPALPECEPCGTEPCPRHKAHSRVLRAAEANLCGRRHKLPRSATTRVTSLGSALP